MRLRPYAIADWRLPGDRLYLLKSSGHRVTMHSYCEDGTVTVNVSGKYNFVTFDRHIFGISPDDLEECDLPQDEEPKGTLLTEKKDVDRFIDAIRPMVLASSEKDKHG